MMNTKKHISSCLIIALVMIVIIAGCKSGPIFDPTGKCLFATKDAGVKTVPKSKENEIRNNTVSDSGNSGSPWLPCGMEAATQAARDAAAGRTGITTWSTQRPNGGVLFPKALTVKGPAIVVEPKTTIAPIGTEIVLVGSYIGPKNEYLMVNEKLNWGLDGVGHFLTTNPDNCLLACDTFNPQKTSDRFLTTVTSSKLWRIHRGTSTPVDDISILKGQSWTTVQSSQEGTSSISVMSGNIDNWRNRSATALIHWVDAAFMFPQSGVAPVRESRMLSTSVFRKTDPAQGRAGWIVRYEVISGPTAGFGQQLAPSIETQTDTLGQSNVILNQKELVAGTNKILVKILRPAGPNADQIVVAEKTISQAWTSQGIFKMNLQGPPSVRNGSTGSYRLDISNITATAQDAIVRMPIPAGTSIVSSTPKAQVENGLATWILERVPARSSVPIQFELKIMTPGSVDFNPSVDRYVKTSTTTPPPAITPIPNATPGSSTAPPVSSGSPLPSPFGGNSGTQSTPANPVNNTPIEFKFIEPFPRQVLQNKQFDTVFTLSNPGNRVIPQVVLSIEFPNGILFVNNGKQYAKSPIAFNPLPLKEIEAKTYPLSLIAQSTGTMTVTLLAKDTLGNQLAKYNAPIQVISNPAGSTPAGSNDPARQPPQLTVDVKGVGAGAPNFTTGTPVLFEFKITNKENYAVSNLKMFCTPEQNRTINPWKFVESLPPGAAAVSSSGSYLLNLPTIPAGKEVLVSMKFDPQQVVTNGKLVAEVQSDEFHKTIAKGDYIYSIAAPRK